MKTNSGYLLAYLYYTMKASAASAGPSHRHEEDRIGYSQRISRLIDSTGMPIVIHEPRGWAK